MELLFDHVESVVGFQAAPFNHPVPPFPEERVNLSRPFKIAGIDLLGHLFLNDGSKVWIALFTCFSVRAVHLELVVNLGETAMLRALQRFCYRRGVPDTIWSDHGTNFIALSRSLRENHSPIKWRWIVERAPWWGGIWEKLCGATKNLLKRTLGTASLTYEELLTTVQMVESALNKRPISFVWESNRGTDGMPVPLTPQDFLLKCGKDTDNVRDDFKALESSWKVLQKRWEEEYLMSVLGSFGGSQHDFREPREGEVVLVLTENRSRLEWPMGRIVQLHRGRDGVVRAASVEVTGKKIMNRPLKKIYPLELETDEVHPFTHPVPITDVQGDTVPESEADDESVDQVADPDPAVRVDRRGREIRRPRRYDD